QTDRRGLSMLVRAATVADLPALLQLALEAGSGLTSLPASEERLERRLQTVEASFAGTLPMADADYLFVLEDASGQVIGTSGVLAAAGLRAGSGLTSRPASEERLERRLQTVEASFAGTLPMADADYLFVLEDASGQVIGTSGVLAAAGLREPWYSYRRGLTVTASRELNVYRQQPTLFLTNDLTGASALCSLFLSPPYRHSLNGRLLSRARFIHMAEFAADFAPRVIAEMRGLSDAEGRSPFWDSLGRHFFRMDFARA